jgi:hypothetical protein
VERPPSDKLLRWCVVPDYIERARVRLTAHGQTMMIGATRACCGLQGDTDEKNPVRADAAAALWLSGRESARQSPERSAAGQRNPGAARVLIRITVFHSAHDAGAVGSAIGGRMKSILDPSFRYTSSLHTDVRKTFQRIRREQQRETPRAVLLGDGGGNVLAIQRRSVSPR